MAQPLYDQGNQVNYTLALAHRPDRLDIVGALGRIGNSRGIPFRIFSIDSLQEAGEIAALIAEGKPRLAIVGENIKGKTGPDVYHESMYDGQGITVAKILKDQHGIETLLLSGSERHAERAQGAGLKYFEMSDLGKYLERLDNLKEHSK